MTIITCFDTQIPDWAARGLVHAGALLADARFRLAHTPGDSSTSAGSRAARDRFPLVVALPPA